MTDMPEEATRAEATDDGLSETRRRALQIMSDVYGMDFADGPGDFFRYTADHLFADIWDRPGLTMRERRLLLIGMLVGAGEHDVVSIQVGAALGNGELTDEQLREIVIFLTHYAGWPKGAKLNQTVEVAIGRAAKQAAKTKVTKGDG